MDKPYFVTITGINHYYGKKPFKIGRVIRLIKEPDNEYDSEAILAFMPFVDTIGYVANSTNTVYDGTISAGRLYDKFDDYAYGKIMFVTHSSAIALVLDKDEVEDDNEEDDEQLSLPKEKSEEPKPKKKTTKTKNEIGFKMPY